VLHSVSGSRGIWFPPSPPSRMCQNHLQTSFVNFALYFLICFCCLAIKCFPSVFVFLSFFYRLISLCPDDSLEGSLIPYSDYRGQGCHLPGFLFFIYLFAFLLFFSTYFCICVCVIGKCKFFVYLYIPPFLSFPFSPLWSVPKPRRFLFIHGRSHRVLTPLSLLDLIQCPGLTVPEVP